MFITDLHPDYILFSYIFPKLDYITLLNFSLCSKKCNILIINYYRVCKSIDYTKGNGNHSFYALKFCQNLTKINFGKQNSIKLSKTAIENVMDNNPNLEEIIIYNTAFDDFSSFKVTIINCLKIFIISNNKNLTDNGIVAILNKFSYSLNNLEISQCLSVKLSDELVNSISKCLNLVKLNVSDSIFVNDTFINSLKTLKQLKYLNISGCNKVTDKSIRSTVIEYLISLEVICTRFCSKLSPYVIRDLNLRGIAVLDNRLGCVSKSKPVQLMLQV